MITMFSISSRNLGTMIMSAYTICHQLLEHFITKRKRKADEELPYLKFMGQQKTTQNVVKQTDEFQ